jgi:hypothetical protein
MDFDATCFRLGLDADEQARRTRDTATETVVTRTMGR